MFDLVTVSILIIEVIIGIGLLWWLFRFIPRVKEDKQDQTEYFVDENPRYQVNGIVTKD